MFQENSGNSEKLPTKRADLEHLFVQDSSSNMEKLRHANNGFYRSTAMDVLQLVAWIELLENLIQLLQIARATVSFKDAHVTKVTWNAGCPDNCESTDPAVTDMGWEMLMNHDTATSPNHQL